MLSPIVIHSGLRPQLHRIVACIPFALSHTPFHAFKVRMLPSNYASVSPSGSGQSQPQPPYYLPKVDQAPLNLESASTIGDSIDMSCDMQTGIADSVWSYDSTRDIGQYVREVNGRRFNAQNSTYILPSGALYSVAGHGVLT